MPKIVAKYIYIYILHDFRVVYLGRGILHLVVVICFLQISNWERS